MSELPPALTERPGDPAGVRGGPGTTAHSQAGRAATSLPPGDRCLWRLGHPTRRVAGPRGPALLGHPTPAGLLLRLGSLRDHQPEAHGPQGPGHLPNPASLLSSLQGALQFLGHLPLFKEKRSFKNLRTASNKPSSDQCRETVSEARQKSDASGLPAPGPRCPPPCTLRRARQAGTLGPAAGWGTHPCPGPGGRAGGPGPGGSGPGAGFRAESFKSFFFLRRQGSPGADGGGSWWERQTDSVGALGYDAH